MALEPIHPFEKEPEGPNVAYMLRVTLFAKEKDYGYGGPIAAFDPRRSTYIHSKGPAYDPIGEGLYCFIKVVDNGYYKRIVEAAKLMAATRDSSVKWQVVKVMKDEVYPPLKEKKHRSDWNSYRANRIWVVYTGDEDDALSYFSKAKAADGIRTIARALSYGR